MKLVKPLIAAAGLWFCSSAGATAQLSITTIGATDAQACYQSALDNFTTSVDDCDEAIKNDGNLSRRDLAFTYVNRGIILNRAGLVSEALEDFEKALKIKSDIPEAFLNRGNSYYLSRQYEKALADYETSLAQGLKKSYAAWYNIGLVYDAMKMPDKARSAYQKAVDIFPEHGPSVKKLERYQNNEG